MSFSRRYVETLLLIGIGGFIGANVRYWVTTWAAQYGQPYPLGTLIINVTGSTLLGIFIGWSGNHLAADPRLRLFVAVGFSGLTQHFRLSPTRALRCWLQGTDSVSCSTSSAQIYSAWAAHCWDHLWGVGSRILE